MIERGGGRDETFNHLCFVFFVFFLKKVEEQLKINESLKTRVDELRKHCSELEVKDQKKKAEDARSIYSP